MASGKRAAAATHLAMGWLVTLSVPMLVLIQSWSLCAVQLTSRQMTTLEVCGEVGGVIRHQQRRRRPRQSAGEAAGVNRRQRTKTSCLVRRLVNAHICSSANLTRISKVKIPNSNSNINFEVCLTSLIKVSFSLCILCSKLYNAHQRPAVAAVHSGFDVQSACRKFTRRQRARPHE